MSRTQKTELLITAINKDLTFSRKNVWLWVRLPATPYEFLDADSRIQIVQRETIGLSSLLTSEDRGLECRIIRTSSPFNSEAWADDLLTHAIPDRPSENLPHLLSRMESHVKANRFSDRKVYFGINLGFRTEYSENGANALPFKDLFNFILPALGTEDYQISKKELDFWEEKAKKYKRSLLTGNLNAEEVSGEELAYIIKKQFFPNMEVPDVNVSKKETWGHGELDALVSSTLKNNPKYVKITQEINGVEVEGYRTTLCFARFPDTYNFPESEPWIHYASSLPFETDFYSHFTIEPARKVRKDINKKIAEIKDQGANMVSAGGSLNIDIQERYDQATQVDFELSRNKTPWVYSRHRMVVEASTESELKDRVQRVIDHYKDLDIEVVQPTGDQLVLFLELMPNDKKRTSTYIQRQDLSILPAGLPSGSGSAGDLIIPDPSDPTGTDTLGFIGPYIGYTTSRILSPWFFSPHASIAAGATNGVITTGSPGSGKSFFASTVAYLSTMLGTWGIYIDPKGDSVQLANLPGMQDKTTIVDLKDGQDGLLDPFSLSKDVNKQKELALETIYLFLGGDSKVTPTQKVEISKAITSVSSNRRPSLDMVSEVLLQSSNVEAQSVGHVLDLIKKLPFARLCFASKKVESLSVERGLTIITLLGLELPDNDLENTQYSSGNKLAMAIMYLLTDYTRQLMQNSDKTHPKMIIIDEAWVITGTPQGLKLVTSVARMGRALNTALMLVSQNAQDFHGDQITNSVSTRIAFGAQSATEIKSILTLLDMEHTEYNISIIRGLKPGEALVKDAHRRFARVKVDPWDQEQVAAFENNPEKVRRNAERAAAKAAKEAA